MVERERENWCLSSMYLIVSFVLLLCLVSCKARFQFGAFLSLLSQNCSLCVKYILAPINAQILHFEFYSFESLNINLSVFETL
jgi:hypothetical protein